MFEVVHLRFDEIILFHVLEHIWLILMFSFGDYRACLEFYIWFLETSGVQ